MSTIVLSMGSRTLAAQCRLVHSEVAAGSELQKCTQISVCAQPGREALTMLPRDQSTLKTAYMHVCGAKNILLCKLVVYAHTLLIPVNCLTVLGLQAQTLL